jgi:hypothetical protein
MSKDLVLVRKSAIKKLQKKEHLLGIIDGLKIVAPFVPPTVLKRLINATQKDIIALNQKQEETPKALVVILREE